MGRLAYLTHAIAHRLDPGRRTCPNCGGTRSELVERKYLVTELRRCSDCLLMFRAPADTPSDAAAFYNESYSEGFTTDTPSPSRLADLKANAFAGSEKDYGYYIDIIRRLGVAPGAKLFDFGCSWGYGSFQFCKAGFDALSYEISAARRQYGIDNLGIHCVADFDKWASSDDALASMDVFFSAHVLEHVPSPSHVIDLAKRVLKPGGLFLAFVPNGGAAHRGASAHWSRLWGQVHPNFLDDVYFNAALSELPRVFGSSPVTVDQHAVALLSSRDPFCYAGDQMRGHELMVAART